MFPTSYRSKISGRKTAIITDLLHAAPIDAKRDGRLKSSGALTGFRFENVDLSQAFLSHKERNTEAAIQYINDFAEALVAPSLKCTNDKYWIPEKGQ